MNGAGGGRLKEGFSRPQFQDAVVGFRGFLAANGWSDQIRWICAEDITGHRSRFWLLRPKCIENERSSESFYNAVIATSSSVRLDAQFQIDEFTFAWVENYGGDGGHLNYGIRQSPVFRVTAVNSIFVWKIRKAANRLPGERSVLKFVKIPKRY